MIDMIKNATEDEITEIVMAALKRYRELFPDWEISTINIDKTEDKNTQLDQMIALLEHMKRNS